VASDLKLDIKKRKKCQWEESIKSRVATQFKEGQTLFSVTGTPGNVILDTVTWQFKLIAGAYPAKTFEEELNKVIK
jgi:protein-disulfide isomerase